MAMGNLVKISFRLDPKLHGGVVGESLWAEQVGRNRFRLDNTPFSVHDVSYRDVVFGRRGRDGRLRFAGISLRGGHSTCWIAARDELESAPFQDRWKRLRELGCKAERAVRLLAVDVPPATDFAAVEELLEAGFVADVWEYEIAHCGHAVGERELPGARGGDGRDEMKKPRDSEESQGF
jgi:hypothetical protein